MPEIIFSNDEFYISYLVELSDECKALDAICHAAGRPEPKDLPETALAVRDDAKLFGVSFYILYGDHRDAYASLAVQGLSACMAYFLANIEHISHSSDVPTEEHRNARTC